MKNKFMPTAIGLYMNYFVHGMGVLILAQNMAALSEKWNTDNAGVAVVISSLGIGRLIVLFASGMLSDKFGRKPFVLLGGAVYISFFVGILLSPSIAVAYIFGILAGIANSFLDSGTYPALIEGFPNAKSTANVIIKAFISAGQFTLPLLVAFLVTNNLWYGWSFMFAVAILVINGIFISTRKFPEHKVVAEAATEQPKQSVFKDKSKWPDLIAFILYGYIAQSTFYLVSVWLKVYGLNVAGMSELEAGSLMSIYAIGSLVCVFFTAILSKKLIKQHIFLVAYTCISMVSLLLLWMNPTPLMCQISAAVIGFSAAGGVLQLGLTIMSDVFASGKGVVTGIYYTSGSIASFTIPLITAMLSKTETGVSDIILFDVFIAAIGFVLAIFIAVRYQKMLKREGV